MFRFALPLAATASLLSGCGSGQGDESANRANGISTGRTENGQLTARVQGVDLKVNLPAPIRRMTEDDSLLYPRARAERGGEGRRFHSDDDVETVTRWYRDPARASRFTIAEAQRQGPAMILAGTLRDGDRLRIRLFPGSAGGTDGTILVTAAN